ncbi:MAG: hypothetical protein JO156_10550 [Solirubrobacterales bacterium]|nr:hypothetical protein [Solirubrobacterales bacterium]
MSRAKLLAASGIVTVALCACGTAAKPLAGSLRASDALKNNVDDPRSQQLPCLRQAHLPVLEVGPNELQIGPLPAGPTIYYDPSMFSALHDQIIGKSAGAEVIGSALLYPHQAPESELGAIEGCLTIGVQG